MDKNAKIYVAGHRGLVGSALIKKLEENGYNNLVKRSHAELDLTDERAVADFLSQKNPSMFFLLQPK